MPSMYVQIWIGEQQITHRGPGPWKAVKFNTGFACVTNAIGVNWIHIPGTTWSLFPHRIADVIAEKFNTEAVPL